MNTKSKPTHGRLVWISNVNNSQKVIDTGAFPLLNFKKNQLKSDPHFSGGRLIITY